MSIDLNRWTGIGRIGRDIELRNTPSGSVVATISLACQDDHKDQNGNPVKRTYWIPITLYGKSAEALHKYAQKGSRIAVEGKLEVREYTDKQGNKRTYTGIVCQQMQLLDSPAPQQSTPPAQSNTRRAPQPAPQPAPQQSPLFAPPQETVYDDDIPF